MKVSRTSQSTSCGLGVDVGFPSFCFFVTHRCKKMGDVAAFWNSALSVVSVLNLLVLLMWWPKKSVRGVQVDNPHWTDRHWNKRYKSSPFALHSFSPLPLSSFTPSLFALNAQGIHQSRFKHFTSSLHLLSSSSITFHLYPSDFNQPSSPFFHPSLSFNFTFNFNFTFMKMKE